MRFLADMGISPRTVDFLRRLGYEVLHLHEAGLDRLADPTILAEVRRTGPASHRSGFRGAARRW